MADQPNLNELMKKAQEMQKKMQEAQNELSRLEIIGESGGGLVKVIMNGRHDAKKVEISDEALKEAKAVLEDLVAAAINDATRKVEQASQSEIMRLTKEMGLPTDVGKTAGEGE
jgi:DNA-binding YbaB/EbfC family protein